MSLTKKQKEVFDYIKDYVKKNHYAPTQREIKEHFNLKSFGSVQKYIKYLSGANLLENDWNARRGLKIIGDPSKICSFDENTIPLLGDIAAGNPIEAIENPDQLITVPHEMIKKGQTYFALTVKGNSMIDDGILDKDIVICKVASRANTGETIVAIVGNNATLKKFYKRKNYIELRPANSRMKPIQVKAEEFKMAGVIAGLIRKF